MDATCTIQDSIHVFNLVHKYVSRILGTYHSYASGWGIFPIPPLFPKPACLSYASGWGIFPIPPIFPQPACKQACSDACAWAIITQKFTPRYVE